MFAPPGIRKPIEYIEARRMRALGFSYKVIAATLEISPSSAFHWTKDIGLSDDMRWQIIHGPKGPQDPEHIAKRVASWRQKNRDRRSAYQAEGRAAARRGDPLHLAGCMLYWAEGSKGRNCAVLANSDPNLVRFFRRFLSECFGVPADHFVLRLNVYLRNGISIEVIEQHWLDALGLPPSVIRKHSINHFPTSSSGSKQNRLPHGVCTLAVCDTRIVQHIYGAIQEYAGFEEPRWLDGPPRKKAQRTPSLGGAAPTAPSGRGGDSRPGPRPRNGRRRGPPC
jgi:hypothetical protein